MDCRKFQKNLEDYLQGGLDFPGRFGMERHAQQCFGCGKDVADAQKIAEMARGLRRVKAPQNFEAAVLARIQSRHATRKRFRVPWLHRWDWQSWRSLAYAVPAAAAVLIAIAVAVPWWRMRENYNPVSPESAISASAPTLPNPELEEGQVPVVRSKQLRQANGPLTVFRPRIPALMTEDVSAPMDAEPGDTGFVEYVVPGPGDRPVIMRLPRSVRMRYGPPSEEYFLRNVSH
jgi:hypothetical protein